MSEKVLTDIGLSINEAKVYMVLLELGLSNVGSIAKKSKVHRSNVYSSLERLEEKGLINSISKEGTKYFDANDPNALLRLLDVQKEKFDTILPEMMLDYKMATKKSNAHIFEGVKSVCDILDGFLKYDEPILVYGVPKQAPEILGDWLTPHHKRRVAAKVKMKHIYNEDSKKRIKVLNKMACTQARYLPKELNSPVSTEICGEEIMFVLWQSPPIVIHIKNKDIADYYKKNFEFLWGSAKDE